MSFILDALKKSEIERQRQTVPGLMDTRIAGRRNRLPTWAGTPPALGATEAGVPVDLPAEPGRRDGSGIPLLQPLAAIGGTPTAF